MKIAIDIDEVLAEFIREFLGWYNQRYGTDWSYDDATDYHWPAFMGNTVEEAVEDAHDFFKTERFKNLPLIKGAKNGISILNEDYELYAVTGRQNAIQDITKYWLEENFPGVFKSVEFTNLYSKDGSPSTTKGEVCEKLGCKILVDDDTRHIEKLMTHGIDLVVFNKPWNGHHRIPPQFPRCNNWDEIVDAVNKLAKQHV